MTTVSIAVIPYMTANNAPLPYVVSANFTPYPTTDIWQGFDNDLNTFIHTQSGTTTGIVTMDLGSDNACAVNKYVIHPQNYASGTRSPKNWTFEGSNNGIDWTTVDTQTNITGWTGSTPKYFSFSNSTPYRYYRLNITANGGDSYLTMGRVQLFKDVDFILHTSGVDDGYTKLLIHGNTAEDAAIVDESGKTITKVEWVRADSLNKKFGASAIYFDGSTAVLNLADSDDWDFGSGDFTVDWWMRPVLSDSAWNTIFIQRGGIDSDALAFSIYPSSGDHVCRLQGNATYLIDAVKPTGGFQDNVWQHMAVVHHGNNWLLFHDGVQYGSTTNSLTLTNKAAILEIGRWRTSYNFYKGYLDEFRISKGIARWTSNFTPPTAPYAPSGKRIILATFI